MPTPIAEVPVNWRVRDRRVAISKPLVMGILNVTPDSFSDGGRFAGVEAALRHAGQMVEEGADGIDVGGESTRPQGAQPVSVDVELARVLPVVSAVRAAFPDVLVSVDTTKSVVAAAALDAGAEIINDVSGFRIDPRIGEIAAARGAGVILVHSRGGVSDMGTYRYATFDDDVVGAVVSEIGAAVESAQASGVARDAIVVDPGIGFAKRSEHSLRVLSQVGRIRALGFPVMVGVSRKRFIGELSRVQNPADRLAGTIGANVMALAAGARLFRVHDVGPHRQALDVAWGIVQARGNEDAGRSDPSPADSPFPIPESR